MKENRDFKGVWIPKEIWLNTDLSIIEKVLLVEIDSLDNSDRGCFASNEYLAKFVQLSESRVAHIISDLKKREYIVVVFTDGRNRGLKLHPQQSRFAKNSKAESLKTTKATTLSVPITGATWFYPMEPRCASPGGSKNPTASGRLSRASTA